MTAIPYLDKLWSPKTGQQGRIPDDLWARKELAWR